MFLSINLLDMIKDWIIDLTDCLSEIDLSIFGYDISFFRLILIVFFAGSAFDIIFSSANDIDSEVFWSDDDDF